MKRILLISAWISLCSGSHVFAQAHFELINLGSVYSQEKIEATLNGADLCGFYYSNDRRILAFDDGAIVELFQMNEISGLSNSCFTEKGQGVNDYDNTWQISDANHLIRRIAINPTK